MKRVKVEAIDFDWVFEGNNCKTLIKLLAMKSESKLLATKSVRSFIMLMWHKYYQKAIIRTIFLKFVIFMFIYIILATYYAGTFIDKIALDNRDWIYYVNRYICMILSTICMMFSMYFMKIEYD